MKHQIIEDKNNEYKKVDDKQTKNMDYFTEAFSFLRYNTIKRMFSYLYVQKNYNICKYLFAWTEKKDFPYHYDYQNENKFMNNWKDEWNLIDCERHSYRVFKCVGWLRYQQG